MQALVRTGAARRQLGDSVWRPVAVAVAARQAVDGRHANEDASERRDANAGTDGATRELLDALICSCEGASWASRRLRHPNP